MPQIEQHFHCRVCGRHLMRALAAGVKIDAIRYDGIYMIPCPSCGVEVQARLPSSLDKCNSWGLVSSQAR
mgnify:CR=1 FL=1